MSREALRGSSTLPEWAGARGTIRDRPRASDGAIVERQLGRAPRGAWRVELRCRSGSPVVIAVAPRLGTGAPFPTALWLTCPKLAALVSDRESAGATAWWSARLRSDPLSAERAGRADHAYRVFRASLGDEDDPCGDVGVAGQSDPLAVKCLHARVAAALCGIDDPAGKGLLLELEGAWGDSACDEVRCTVLEATGPAAR